MHGFELQLLPVTRPGVEQKATWLQIRQQRPDYVLLWGWGVMNSTALKEAQATGYPREKMYGVWWAGAEPDVKDVGDGAKGYNALTLQHGAEPNAKVVKDILAMVHDKGQGTGPKEEVGQVLYMRGVISAMLGVEGVRARAGALRQGQGHDRRAGALGPGEPEPDAGQARRAGLRRRDAADQHLVRRPHGRGLGAHPHLGRQQVELHLRLAAGRRADHQADGQGGGRQVRGREEADARARRRTARPERLPARRGPCTSRLPPDVGSPPAERRAREPCGAAAAIRRSNERMSNILLNVNGIEVIYNHVILVLKGVSLQVPEGGIVALLGGNGAGKTTTLRAVSQPAAPASAAR